jgi:diguanylate cyclase (GGDEF)-like protein
MIARPPSILGRFKLTSEIGALTIAAVLATSSALLVLVYTKLQSDIAQRAVRGQELSVRIGASLLQEAFPQAEITWSPEHKVERIVMDRLPRTGDQVVVDKITRITGEPATLFAYDEDSEDFVRVATTVKRANGSHAVGTFLGKKSAAYERVRHGQAYSGRADILGFSYYTDYHPIFDRQGDVIGVIFAGVKAEAVAASARELVRSIVLASGILLAIMATISVVAARAFVRPVPILANVMRRLAKQVRDSKQDLDSPIPYFGWKNEIGDMANALEVFRAQAVEKARVEKKAAEQANIKLAFALENMTRGLSMFDADHRLVVCNKIYRDIYGLPEDLTQPGACLIDILRYDAMRAGNDGARSVELVELWLEELRAKLARGETFSEEQTLKDGRVLSVTFHPLADGGWVDLHEDITERRRTEAKLNHMARHDALTDLPNRVFLDEQLERLTSPPGQTSGFAILCLDLDGFKQVNDTFGHAIGDHLLKKVAARLIQCVRERDVVARIGGDEFAILQTDVEKPKATRTLATRLLESISAPYELDGKRMIVGTSIGIAIAPQDGEDPVTLLKNADLALYHSKTQGRGCFRYFEQQMSSQTLALQSPENDLSDAAVK